MRNLTLFLAGFSLLVAAAPSLAHHSFAAEYDANKPINLTGKVTKIEWTNPHVWFYVDTKDVSGDVGNWGVELGSPNGIESKYSNGVAEDEKGPAECFVHDGI